MFPSHMDIAGLREEQDQEDAQTTPRSSAQYRLVMVPASGFTEVRPVQLILPVNQRAPSSQVSPGTKSANF